MRREEEFLLSSLSKLRILCASVVFFILSFTMPYGITLFSGYSMISRAPARFSAGIKSRTTSIYNGIYCMPAEGVDLMSHTDILTYEEIHTIVKLAPN